MWPTNDEVRALIDAHVHSDMFRARYADVYHGDERWRAIEITGGDTYDWPAASTYIQNPPYFEGMTMTPKPLTDIDGARALAVFGDSITTDHISPAGRDQGSTARRAPTSASIRCRATEFNSYGARRGNHQVMMRGTFANIRIRNRMLDGVEGGMTRGARRRRRMPIYDAAMEYQADGHAAGRPRGQGIWHRLVARLGGQGHHPARRPRGASPKASSASTAPTWSAWACSRCSSATARAPRTYGLDGSETFAIAGIADIEPRQDVTVQVTRADGETLRPRRPLPHRHL